MHTPPPIDQSVLRQTFGVFPTGVTVMTTTGTAGAPVGLTVNSFNSVSLDPPLIVWSLSRRSGSLRAFQAAEHFAVNILAADQSPVSRRFASRVPDKFRGIPFQPGEHGSPLLDGCAAWIECMTWSMQPTGDHVLFIGRVESVRLGGRPPLLFVGGQYHDVGAVLG
ncbi:MAG: flavin reductase family protein [Limnobacter sp.]|nr:flavin reductase family protein [Limnobacter sp.]